ncbi:hypothetical protein [Phocaeicola vulgatus]|nr:hypothetical protein [Phocaeicola vulgatus]
MDKRFNELLENVKNQILDVFPEMDRDDREEFFNRLNEWSYEKYEEALLESELETPDYGEEYENRWINNKNDLNYGREEPDRRNDGNREGGV